MVHIQKLEQKHLTEALELCRENGWNQLHQDWLRILCYEPDGCFAAFRKGKLIGTVTSTRYGNQLAWIGMMLVHSEYRRSGIGQRLIETCLEFLEQRSIKTIRLDATPMGYPLYKKLSFQSEHKLRRWHRKSDRAFKKPGEPITGLTTPSSDQLSDTHKSLDQTAFGCDREEWLNRVLDDSHLVCHENGFGMIRSGYLADYLGPVCATDQVTAQRLIERLVNQTERDIFWDILAENKIAESVAQKFGFVAVRDLTRMYRGERQSCVDPHILYGLADPAVG